MRKNQYLYLGDKTGRKMYYAIEEEKFYWGNGIESGLMTSLIAFSGTVFYTFTRNLKFPELYYNETAYVICSAIAGLLLSIIFQQYTIRSTEKYFSAVEPAEPPAREQMVKILRQAARFTLLYHIFRIAIVILLIFVPFLIKQEQNIIMFFSYFVVWFVFGIFMQMSLRKRRKVLKKLKKQYL